jgi:hypothetical protein
MTRPTSIQPVSIGPLASTHRFARSSAVCCSYCHREITGTYKYNDWGAFCPQCEAKSQDCRFCHRRVLAGEGDNANGSFQGVRCPVCRDFGVDSVATVEPITRFIVPWLLDQGIQLTASFKFKLCAEYDMPKTSRQKVLGVSTNTTWTQDGRPVRRVANGIYILRGMPSILCCGVIIHELGHAWLAMQQVAGLPSWAEEGFCNYLEHRFYAAFSSPQHDHYRRSTETDQDPVYGDGFRYVYARAQQLGHAGLIQALIERRAMP